MTFSWKYSVHNFEDASWEGGFFFSLIKQYRPLQLSLRKEMFVLPSACVWLVSAFLLRNYGKEQDVSASCLSSNKVCHLLRTKVLSSSLHDPCPASLSKLDLWATGEEWSPIAFPLPGAFSVFVSAQANKLSRKGKIPVSLPLNQDLRVDFWLSADGNSWDQSWPFSSLGTLGKYRTHHT